MITRATNINLILHKNLCVGCGMCVTCPKGAITLTYNDWEGYKPELAREKCVDCGLCVSLCPSYGLFTDQSDAINIKGGEGLIGRYLNTYMGYSCDSQIRYESSSGGIVTTLLLTALEKGMIDGAILTKMSCKDPTRAEICIATNKEDILSCKGSIYNICPVGLGLNQIENREGKFALVGLPCHILAYRKALRERKIANEKIVLYMGLFCNHTLYPQATKFLLQREGITLDKVRQISYRGSGWPGGMTVRLESGDEVSLQEEQYWMTYFSSYFFTPLRCLLCNDTTAELADISVGDAWLPDVKKRDKMGTSLVISRSQMAEDLLGEATAAGRIYIEELPQERIIQSQKGTINFKKRDIRARARIIDKLIQNLEPTGTLPIAVGRTRVFSYIVTILVLLNYSISRRVRLYSLLLRIPKRFLRLYNKGIEFLKVIG